jgi:hypothetical protein
MNDFMEPLQALSVALQLPADEVLSALGGGWSRAAMQTMFDDTAWFAAGTPAVALLGVQADRNVVVARPRFTPAGLHGPGGFNAEGSQLLKDPSLQALAAALTATANETRRSWMHCHGCRELRPLAASSMGHRWCDGCASTYLGLIVC